MWPRAFETATGSRSVFAVLWLWLWLWRTGIIFFWMSECVPTEVLLSPRLDLYGVLRVIIYGLYVHSYNSHFVCYLRRRLNWTPNTTEQQMCRERIRRNYAEETELPRGENEISYKIRLERNIRYFFNNLSWFFICLPLLSATRALSPPPRILILHWWQLCS